jgi:hypothetical protein
VLFTLIILITMFKDHKWCLNKVNKEDLALLFIIIFLTTFDTLITATIVYFLLNNGGFYG